MRTLPPARYTDEDWQIVRACFTLLRHAAGQFRSSLPKPEQSTTSKLRRLPSTFSRPDDEPTDAALALADGIRHLLVDEFQDTSRRQHELLAASSPHGPNAKAARCFVVGDPMQSIYFFRDADAELFPRVREAGLEIPSAEPTPASIPSPSPPTSAPLKQLVNRLNEVFRRSLPEDDGSGVTFSAAELARNEATSSQKSFELHINFAPQLSRSRSTAPEDTSGSDTPQSNQVDEIVALIRTHSDRIEQARENGEAYRVAVLGRKRNALAPIAEALRQAGIPFRSVDLEKLSARPEVLDALALARALLNPLDRVAWLGVLRAPWCGLSLADLHALTSADDPALLARPILELLTERIQFLSDEGRLAAGRVIEILATVPSLRFARPTASLGTWLQQVWLRLGGAQCVDATARANLDLLWQSLDSLPNGEQDVIGPALDAALESSPRNPTPRQAASAASNS